jgi:hypothetical protein
MFSGVHERTSCCIKVCLLTPQSGVEPKTSVQRWEERPTQPTVSDPAHPEIDENRFQKCDWEEFCRDASEAIPGNAPKARGNVMTTHCFVDANHAGDTETRRSQTGMLLFCNRAPTAWFSKRQNSVEASTFGSEFTAMKNAVEMTEAMRHKLRMFGVPIEGPTNIFCDNGASAGTRLNPSQP